MHIFRPAKMASSDDDAPERITTPQGDESDQEQDDDIPIIHEVLCAIARAVLIL
jgi:hypothetical protein